MALLLGTDEAGYGPNLGPLVIAATAWRTPRTHAECDLYELLEGAVSRQWEAGDDGRIAIADSKALFTPAGTLGRLELAVHAGLSLLNRQAARWQEVWPALLHEATSQEAVDYDEALPLDCPAQRIAAGARRWADALAAADCSLARAQRAVAIDPRQFNERTARLGSKGMLLTEATLELIRDTLKRCPCEPARVFCDKHGGRNRYAAALTHVWPEARLEVVKESRPQSVYRLTMDGRVVEFRFCVGGESHMPAALASMTAKYLRELAMRAFNDFWRRHVPELRPTAGYPSDAKRFKADIAAAQRRLGIDDADVWRAPLGIDHFAVDGHGLHVPAD